MQLGTLLTFFCISSSLSTFANSLDSTGIENDNGKQIIIYKIEPKETYYSLGRKYHVPPKSIIEYNTNTALHPGTQIRIPTDRPYQVNIVNRPEKPAAQIPGQVPLIDYKVGPKETLYSIAKRFNTTVEDIERANNLKDSGLQVGQIIKVPQGSSSAAGRPAGNNPQPAAAADTSSPAKLMDKAAADSSATDQENKFNIASNRYGLKEQTEHGVAVSIDDQSVDPTKMLVLHRTAPLGTIIKITNPMTEKSTFAKVVGKFAENENTKDVIIVVTKAAADVLGALDRRFQVNIVYGVPNNEQQ